MLEAWAREIVLPALNEAVRGAATRHGWAYVGGIAEDFQGDGYCVGDSGQNFLPDRWIRTAAPSVSCDGPDGQWHATDVNVACTASDGGSGLADPADASFSLSTAVPAGTETVHRPFTV